MNYNLVKINSDMGILEYDMYQEIPEKEIGATNDAHGMTFQEFKEYLKILTLNENRNIDESGTPVNTYIMYVNNYPVGYIGIRTKINEQWKIWSGNIFYSIRPSERKKTMVLRC